MSFDTLAPWYRTLEAIAFGDALQRCRVACFDQVATPRRALIVGEGNGRFLCELLRRHPGVEVDCVDASERMLQLAQERVEEVVGERPNVRWLHQDITEWTPPERHYDLVVTHFVLDCFAGPTIETVVQKLARAATDDASWLLADFSIPKSGFDRLHTQVWLAVMYWFFRLATRIEAKQLVDPTPLIQSEGFKLVRYSTLRGGFLRSELWSKEGRFAIAL